jgi:phosphonate transport system substrate-binding protein
VKRLGPLIVLLSSLFFSLSLGGCKSTQASDGRPAVLHYAFSPDAEQLQSGTVRTVGLRKYLEKQLHMPVEVVRVEGYAPTIEAMRAHKVDIAGYGALGYIIAARNAGAEALVSTGDANGKLGGYRSVIAVPKNSPIHSIEELKAHAKNIVFAFADPASTSGNLYPRVYLQSIGIHPEHDFKKVIFADGHIACIMAVKAGKIDAGGFAEATINRLIATGKMKADDVRVLWTSDLIPNGPTIAVRKDLPEQLKKDIQTAMTSISTKDPELWAELAATIRRSSTGMTYIPVNDATYNGLRQYAAQVKDFNFVEK